jgi:hypothetical protein
MPRDGAQTLPDLTAPRFTVACGQCGRRGSYSVARLRSQHGDARLTDLRDELTADCERKSAQGLHDPCSARFEF